MIVTILMIVIVMVVIGLCASIIFNPDVGARFNSSPVPHHGQSQVPPSLTSLHRLGNKAYALERDDPEAHRRIIFEVLQNNYATGDDAINAMSDAIDDYYAERRYEALPVCPECEKNKISPPDYLCEECR